MDKQELLRSLGLSTYESAVYEALLGVGQAKVQDLAQLVDVPRPQIYVALGTLMEKGICREIRGKVTMYAAIPPAVAFRPVLRQEEELLKAKAEGIRKLDEEQRTRVPEDVPQDFVQVLKGRQVKHFIDELAAGTTDQLLIALKYTHKQSAKSLAGAMQSEAALLGRGVKVRCLYERASLEQPEVRAALRQLGELGEDARVIPAVPMDLMVFDARAALFSLTTARDVTVFAFTHPNLVETVRNSFEYLWQQGRDVKETLAVRHDGSKMQQE